MIKTAHINLLESASTVDLFTATEDAACPLYRLYDRNVGRPFRTTLAETTTVRIVTDPGKGPGYPLCDSLIIPEGHNLEGMALSIRHSDDDLDFTDAVPTWTGTEGTMVKSWTGIGKKYWRFIITSPSEIPSIPELLLTSVYEWERMPARPSGPLESAHNVMSAFTAEGRQRFLVQGPPVTRRTYEIPRCPLSMRDELLALWQSRGEGKPFMMLDHEGQWLFVSIEGELELMEVAHEVYSARMQLRQVLP